jgi:hypothetical protein
VLGNSVSAFTGVPLLPQGKTWSGPLSFAGNTVLTNAEGDRFSLDDAARATVNDPAVAQAWTRTVADASYQRYGGVLMGTGALLGAIYGGVVGSSTTTSAATVGVVAAAAGGPFLLGTGMLVKGTTQKRKHREALLSAINAAE